jgi:hypothetical protein
VLSRLLLADLKVELGDDAFRLDDDARLVDTHIDRSLLRDHDRILVTEDEDVLTILVLVIAACHIEAASTALERATALSEEDGLSRDAVDTDDGALNLELLSSRLDVLGGCVSVRSTTAREDGDREERGGNCGNDLVLGLHMFLSLYGQMGKYLVLTGHASRKVNVAQHKIVPSCSCVILATCGMLYT